MTCFSKNKTASDGAICQHFFKSRFYKALFQTRKLALFPFKKEKDLFLGNLKGVYFLLNLKGAISSGQDNKAQSRMWQGSWLTFSITADH